MALKLFAIFAVFILLFGCAGTPDGGQKPAKPAVSDNEVPPAPPSEAPPIEKKTEVKPATVAPPPSALKAMLKELKLVKEEYAGDYEGMGLYLIFYDAEGKEAARTELWPGEAKVAPDGKQITLESMGAGNPLMETIYFTVSYGGTKYTSAYGQGNIRLGKFSATPADLLLKADNFQATLELMDSEGAELSTMTLKKGNTFSVAGKTYAVADVCAGAAMNVKSIVISDGAKETEIGLGETKDI